MGGLEVGMTVVPWAGQRKKDGFLGLPQRARVGIEVPNHAIGRAVQRGGPSLRGGLGLAPGPPRVDGPPSSGHSTGVWLAATYAWRARGM